MSKLNIELREALQGIQRIEESGKTFEENFMKINSAFENLGNSWKDSEYEKAKVYLEKAKSVIQGYIKSTVEYTGEVAPRLKQLEQEYLETSDGVGGLDLGDLGDLELGDTPNVEVDKPVGKYDYVGEFKQDLAVVEKNGLKGFINREEIEVIPVVYDNASNFFANGKALVEKNNTYGLINTTGIIVKTLYYDYVEITDDGIIVEQNGKRGKLNIDGEIILHLGQLEYTENELELELELEDIYDTINGFSEGLAVVSKNNKYGYINENNEVIVPIVYDSATNFMGGKAEVILNDKKYLIDKAGIITERG